MTMTYVDPENDEGDYQFTLEEEKGNIKLNK